MDAGQTDEHVKPSLRGPGASSRRWSLAAACALAASFIFEPTGLPRVSLCWFRSLSGYPCPACGLTRAFCAIGHGDFVGSWEFNPFAFVFFAVAAFVFLRPVLDRVVPGLTGRLTGSRTVSYGTVSLVVALIVFGVARITAS